MRQLREAEYRSLADKLSKYIQDIKPLLERGNEKYGFYYHRGRVFYCRDDLARRAENITRKNLLSFGTCFGKFTKNSQFRLHITALPYLTPYAKYRIWLKPSAEQHFLYGQHIVKSGLARVSEDTPQYAGVIVMNANDTPLGFGVAAKSTLQMKNTDPMTIIGFHQADIGEYIRSEETIV
ncbi:60S ribosome subunit biogenesis protein NIP7 [Echinococcus granulosus]|uniref:60S ribosome subunit biogenesis protein NIP7 homolog n=1 Tax=Echinococcus granulosus TaxID=6210 RepID=W6UR56_ECHGR|nr:60S ribosome subunit biogenesis protein NIP7 [Echinococcus granulosus]EUB63708.1 60S ribosome subunit biogenesis protein NIP7 [Echinococcus granulosus]